MLKKVKALPFLVLLSSLVILSSCQSESEEDVLDATEKIAAETFESKASIKVNQKLDHLSLYLPGNIYVEEETENNIILSDGQQTYITFYNKLEEPLSELYFHTAEEQNNEALLLKSFQDNHKFGYIQVLPERDKTYELQIGIGGVKITTLTSKDKMITHTKELMKIARSIVENGMR